MSAPDGDNQRSGMAYREFEDAYGRSWRAWDVHPSHAERRTGSERREAALLRPERRRLEEPRVLMPPELMAGWLCFEADGERRRLVPIPPDWDSASVDQLREWLQVAAPSPLRGQGR